jgi:predicted NAD/FAD-binding protein
MSLAVIGSGIAGMSAAWLLSQGHEVTVYEKDSRLGGHTNTVAVDTDLGPVPVDTGFIVFNTATYPNLTALFEHLNVWTEPSDMSFGVSLRSGEVEYSSVDALAFLCNGRNLLSPRFWSMTLDLIRFYKYASLELVRTGEEISLGDYLTRRNYGDAFQNDLLLPQAAAIWSASVAEIRHYPACAFVRFFENHGLLNLTNWPVWRTVACGAREYVSKLTNAYAKGVRLGNAAISVRRDEAGVWVCDANGGEQHYDQIVIATHANDALALLVDPSPRERALLAACRYSKNRAVLHTDRTLMPRRQQLWASWNYVGENPNGGCVVSYWMNRLQNLSCREQFFLTLNPKILLRSETIVYDTEYDHPLYDAAAMRAQEQLWSLQGVRNTWFCGAYFGAGFHEDGLQAGLAVAEQLGGVKRPWVVDDESGRIHLTPRRAFAA